MQKLSQIFSAIFSPLLVPTYGMILIAGLTILRILSLHLLLTAVGITFVMTFVIPVIAIIALCRTGVIKDKTLGERSERTIPYSIATICYIGCGITFGKVNAPLWIPLFFVGIATATLITALVNLKWKISAHGVAVGGLVAMMFRIVASHYAIYNMNLWLSAVIILAGFVMTARVYLERHTLWQVLAGCANGFACVYLLSMIA